VGTERSGARWRRVRFREKQPWKSETYAFSDFWLSGTITSYLLSMTTTNFASVLEVPKPVCNKFMLKPVQRENLEVCTGLICRGVHWLHQLRCG
jgi:hypothetical protein